MQIPGKHSWAEGRGGRRRVPFAAPRSSLRHFCRTEPAAAPSRACCCCNQRPRSRFIQGQRLFHPLGGSPGVRLVNGFQERGCVAQLRAVKAKQRRAGGGAAVFTDALRACARDK
ncbi:unnamed protein product [Lampetra planeri]